MIKNVFVLKQAGLGARRLLPQDADRQGPRPPASLLRSWPPSLSGSPAPGPWGHGWDWATAFPSWAVLLLAPQCPALALLCPPHRQSDKGTWVSETLLCSLGLSTTHRVSHPASETLSRVPRTSSPPEDTPGQGCSGSLDPLPLGAAVTPQAQPFQLFPFCDSQSRRNATFWMKLPVYLVAKNGTPPPSSWEGSSWVHEPPSHPGGVAH